MIGDADDVDVDELAAPGSAVKVRIRVPTALRELAGGAQAVDVLVEGDTVGDGVGGGGGDGDRVVTVQSVLDALAASHPALERRVRDELGHPRVHVNLFVGADNVRDLDGLATRVAPGAELSIIPAVSGG